MSEFLTVTEFVEVVNGAFDAVGEIIVEGEVADFNIIHNKWVTFQLKDKESTIPCFMTVWQLKTQLEDGMLVRAAGTPRLRNKGFFSFVLQSVSPVGEGSLRRAFELLQRKLEAEGLFATDRKRPLPQFPEHIALITSPQGAAYTDFIKVLKGRSGGMTISFIPSQVQGEPAIPQLLQALEIVNTELSNIDVVVMVRGGGSLEDLQAFNSEDLVRAIAASRTPTMVGIGHEKDVSLAELAADVRASTPSNAAELLVRSRVELVSQLESNAFRLQARMKAILQEHKHVIQHNAHVLATFVTSAITSARRVTEAMDSTQVRFHDHIVQMKQQLAVTTRMLEALSPEHTLRRGYSITRHSNGALVKRATDVKPEEIITTTTQEGAFQASVTKIDS